MGGGQIDGDAADGEGEAAVFDGRAHPFPGLAYRCIGQTYHGKIRKSAGEIAKEKALKALSEFLRPEFLARVDEVVVFNPLTKDNFIEISRLMLEEYVPSLAERGVKLVITDAAVECLAEKSVDGKSAARDLRNLIRREVEDEIAKMIIDRMENLPPVITVDAEEGNVILRCE